MSAPNLLVTGPEAKFGVCVRHRLTSGSPRFAAAGFIGARDTIMTWTPEQLAVLAAEYARIGYVEGERWPAPPPTATPEDILAMMRGIPDAAGRAGFLAALAHFPFKP
jgi:hypothetical protein